MTQLIISLITAEDIFTGTYRKNTVKTVYAVDCCG